MILLNCNEIRSAHTRLIQKTGGLDGVRDIGLLESTVLSTYSSFSDTELYPTIEEKAARLAFSIISNHAFIDGNKRIGLLVMLMTLQLSHIKLIYTQDELVKLGLGIADGSIGYEYILVWIIKHRDTEI